MTVTTPATPHGWSPDQTAFTPDDLVPQALILQAATVAGQIEGDQPALRVPYVADDGLMSFVDEGDTLPSPEQEFSEVVILTQKLGSVGSYSYETLQQPNAARLVADSLSRSLVRSADNVFCTNADTEVNTGLFVDTSVIDGGTVTNLDGLIDAVASVEDDGGQATAIIASPRSWATLAKIPAQVDSNMSLLGAGTTDAERRVLSLPVLTSSAVPVDAMAVIGANSVIAATSPVRLDRSVDAGFDQDAIKIRAIWRIGWRIMRPNRVVRLSTTEG